VLIRSVWHAIPRPLRAFAAGLTKSLLDPASANRTAAILLLGYAILWGIAASVRTVGLAVHSDMLQVFAYSREFGFGYQRHPPLINWIVAAYFAVMPIRPWAYYLLAGLNAALGLYAVWLAAAYIVDQRRRVIAVALLGLIPPYTFLAATFNHNAIQLSIWPLVALAFLVSITRRGLGWSVLFGVMSALALLAKYYAFLIVLACILAALVQPDWRGYFRSWRPYVAALSCIVVMIPNLIWLAEVDFFPVKMPIDGFGHMGPWTIAELTVRYLVAFVLYMMPALLALALLVRVPSWDALRCNLRIPVPSGHAVVICLALAPALLPLVILPFVSVGTRVPWMLPVFFFTPLLLLSVPGLFVGRRAVALAIVGVAGLAAIAVIISPILMVTSFRSDAPLRVAPYRALAEQVTDIWNCRSGERLDMIAGTDWVMQAISFYSKDHPVAVLMDGVAMPTERFDKRWSDSNVGVCERSNDDYCYGLMARKMPDAEQIELTMPVRFLGMERQTDRYTLFLRRESDASGTRPRPSTGSKSPAASAGRCGGAPMPQG
jgi:4-amino-4-deoxy-L-arabinose transferase-like glycosyltransferase